MAELVMMAREQGREVQIIAADRRSQMNLKQVMNGCPVNWITGTSVSCWKAWPSFRRQYRYRRPGEKALPERDVNPAGWCRTS
ncbi:hypothetical protein MF573_00315 [Klebsiella pneumoniae]|nr:hypothetical protein MF573_00315 [Klebsiella pneumoniae]